MRKLIIAAATTLAAIAAAGTFAARDSECCSVSSASATPVQRAAATTLHIDGMTCGACATAVIHALKKVDGIKDATVSLEEKKVVVSYDPAKVSPERIARAVSETLPAYKATVEK